MRSRVTRALVLGTAVTAAFLSAPPASQATPASGISSPGGVVTGSFTSEVDIKLRVDTGRHHRWLRADDSTQIATQSLTFAPGATTGWVTHPGPEIITIVTGTLTFYQGVGRCQGIDYPAGSAVVQDGSVAHLARNETAEPVETTVIFFGVDKGDSPRVDVPTAEAPTGCPR